MEGPRAPLENELPELLKFLDRTLRPEQSWSVASEYPTVFNKKNIHNMRILTEADRILSHAVMKPLIVKTPLLIYKIAAIGSVVTDDQRRGEGLSSQIMDSCLAEATKQGCDFALLWTGIHDFYRKKGFELAGYEENLRITDEFEPTRQDLVYYHGKPIAPESLLNLYSQHTVGTARSAEDIKKFLQIPCSRIHSAWDKHGKLVAYAIEGKGADLTDHIHEWGGSVSAIVSLLSSIRSHKQKDFHIIMPNHAVNLMVALHKIPMQQSTGYLGMVKILRPDLFLPKIKKAARSLGISDLVLDYEDGKFNLGVGKHILKEISGPELVQIIFGPTLDIAIEQEARDVLGRIFPLPLWIWGWDSV